MRTTFVFPVRPVIIVKLLVLCLTALTALLLTYSWCWHTFCKTVWLHRNNRNSDDLWRQSAEDTSAHIYNQKKQACCVCGAENEPNVSLLWDTAGTREKQKWSDLMSPNYQVDVNLEEVCAAAAFGTVDHNISLHGSEHAAVIKVTALQWSSHTKVMEFNMALCWDQYSLHYTCVSILRAIHWYTGRLVKLCVKGLDDLWLPLLNSNCSWSYKL